MRRPWYDRAINVIMGPPGFSLVGMRPLLHPVDGYEVWMAWTGEQQGLLQTKLHIPRLRPALVARPHLLDRLDAGQQARLTLVSAPAGFGKTTLLSEWAARGGQGLVAWLSLDEDDNDPARFLAYLAAALETVLPGISVQARQEPGGPPVTAILTQLLNEAAASPRPFSLVLDDYHLIDSQPIHRALAYLVEHLPAQMHLIIATRADPPLPLARLRARGQLVELRQADLRFTPQEASEFLKRVSALALSAEDVATLASRTEGWAAGLQMAAISLQGRDDVAGFLRAFAGTNRHILDYLLEEVLERQPAWVQSFLLRTAVLDRLCGPLCDALLSSPAPAGGESGQATLELLERHNLFVVPLDDARRWYRYHQLFADLLRRHLQQAEPELVPALHRRASEWHERQGLAAEAIEHALAAGDPERAARLVEGASEATMMRSEVATLLRWLQALPEGLVRTRPALCLYQAFGLLLAGQPLEMVTGRLEGQAVDGGKLTALRAFGALFEGHISLAAGLARQALTELPEADTFWRAVAGWAQSVCRSGHLSLEGRERELDALVRRSMEGGQLLLAVSGLCQLGELYIAQGRLDKAEQTYRHALDLARDPQGAPLPVASQALAGLAELRREWNDLPEAAALLAEGIELSRQWAQLSTVETHICLAGVRQAGGDAAGARQAMQEAEHHARRSAGVDVDSRIVAMAGALLAIVQGDLAAAERWAEGQGAASAGFAAPPEDPADVGYRLRKYERLVLARLRLAQERPGEVLALLEPLLAMAEAQGRVAMLIEALALAALAVRQQGDAPRAAALLQRALALAEPGGYVRMFVDLGEPMAQLLAELRELTELEELRGLKGEDAHRVRAYAQRLLNVMGEPSQGRAGAPSDPSNPSGPSTPLIEPLSERELEVLTLISQGLSNQEIGARLYIALRTVKWHCSNIYGKLGVKSRTEAVATARALGILKDF